jgi:hypothetical protein
MRRTFLSTDASPSFVNGVLARIKAEKPTTALDRDPSVDAQPSLDESDDESDDAEDEDDPDADFDADSFSESGQESAPRPQP